MRPIHYEYTQRKRQQKNHEQEDWERSLDSLIQTTMSNESSSSDDEQLAVEQDRLPTSANSICESVPYKAQVVDTTLTDEYANGSVFQTMLWQPGDGLCCRADDTAPQDVSMDELVFFEDIDDQEFEDNDPAPASATNNDGDTATAFSVSSLTSGSLRFTLGGNKYNPRPSSTTPSIRDFPKLFDGWENTDTTSNNSGRQLRRSSTNCDGSLQHEKPFLQTPEAIQSVKPKATRLSATSSVSATTSPPGVVTPSAALEKVPQEPITQSSLKSSEKLSGKAGRASSQLVFSKLQLSRKASRSLPAQSLSHGVFKESRARSTDLSRSSSVDLNKYQWTEHATKKSQSSPPVAEEEPTLSAGRRSPKMKSLGSSFKRSVKSWKKGTSRWDQSYSSHDKDHQALDLVDEIIFGDGCNSQVDFVSPFQGVAPTPSSSASAFGRLQAEESQGLMDEQSDASSILASLEATLKEREQGAFQKWASHRATTLRQQQQLQRGVYIQPAKKCRSKQDRWSSSGSSRTSVSSRPGCNDDSHLTEDTEQSENSSFDDIFCAGGSCSGDDSLLDGDVDSTFDSHISGSTQSSDPVESVLSGGSSHASRSRNIKIRASGLNQSKDLFSMDDSRDLSRCNSVDTAKISNLSYDPIGQDRMKREAQWALKRQEEEMRKMRDAPPIDFDAGNNLIRVRDYMCEIEVLPKHQLPNCIQEEEEEEEWPTTPETTVKSDACQAKSKGKLISRVISMTANKSALESGMPRTAAEF